MTLVDWLAVGLVLAAALGGAARGFVWSGLSLVGMAAGAVIGGRLAPLLLARGSSSPYAPAIALAGGRPRPPVLEGRAGAVTLALVFEVLASGLGASVRRRETHYLRELDSMAGVVAGALIGHRVE